MRYSRYLIPTLREIPSEAEIPSHRFAYKGGYIKKIASGIYDYMPLGLRVLKKIETIIREEMNAKEGIEVLMPAMIPAELWHKSGRWHLYGKELLRIKDRADREFCYGPTHEEVVVDLVTNNVKSYKQLPITLYQIQNKFRDEIRPRFGLMRAREFTMKDAYSFHAEQNSLDQTYTDMFEAYSNIFTRCGLQFRVVRADSGNIGGNASQEFMITADAGEDEILYCTNCDYAANVEKAGAYVSNEPDKIKQKKEVYTPNLKSIEDVSNFLNLPTSKFIKALVYGYQPISDNETTSHKTVLIFIRGDYELNEIKLGNILNAQAIWPSEENDIEKDLNAPAGFIGPIGITNKNLTILFDDSLVGINNAVVGSNKKDYHTVNVNPDKDFIINKTVDIKIAKQGDTCCECQKGTYKKERGIEVGHIFKLGTKYSSAMNSTYLDSNGKEQVFIMGCYGIGVGRTAMSAIEQSHDEKGPIWPIQIAPFEVIVMPANKNNEKQTKAAENIYKNLLANNIDTLYDDRNERLGVKFNDADLIGAPIRIIIGKGIEDNQIEINYRAGSKKNLNFDEVVKTITAEINRMKET